MNAAQKRDYYEVLEIERSASAQEIKAAYRNAALKHHPDKNPGDKAAEEKFKEASEAYAVLSDADKRARYDRFGHASVGANPFEGFGGFGGFQGSLNDLFGDLFSELFGGGRGRAARGPARGADLRHDVTLTFEEAVFGKEINVTFPRDKGCEECGGSGARKGTSPKVCPNCHGSGEVRFSQGFFQVAKSCGQCRGEGKVVESPCGACRGRGKVQESVSRPVSIPAGVSSGTRMRVAGEGGLGERGGPRGDLYLFLSVRDHPLFQREENDLYCEVPVTFPEAALGTNLSVPTIDGQEVVKIPPGTQSGKLFRIKGKGVPFLNGRGRGDQHFRVVIETPTHLTKEQRKHLEAFAAASGPESHPQAKGFWEKVKEAFTAEARGS